MKRKNKSGISEMLKPYLGLIIGIISLSIISNSLNLVFPKIISSTIDSLRSPDFSIWSTAQIMMVLSLGVFVFSVLQYLVQVYTAEKVAVDMRNKLIKKISRQDYDYIEKATSSKLLTNMTSDIESLQFFVSSAISSIISSLFLIVGASILLLIINWQLALVIMSIIPVIGIIFFLVLSRVHKLFIKSQESIDKLNKVINESIIGAMLIRILSSQNQEIAKFRVVNMESKEIGMSILRHFAFLVPTINLIANVAAVAILAFGGYQIINGVMTIGEFTAFNSYLLMLIFPIIVISFMINAVSQANVSYGRIKEVLDVVDSEHKGKTTSRLSGALEVKDLCIENDGRKVLKGVSFSVTPGSKIAIIGPTAGGKTQLIHAMVGLIKPSNGEILYDGVSFSDYSKDCLYRQIGLVFQDSMIFNLSLRENISFSRRGGKGLEKAIETAELSDFIDVLPDGLNTVLSERGTNLSGGQKQRITLARALAHEPKILFLDDFTARVDQVTEQKILDNVLRNYPGITIISVTQKIDPIKDYDQIILIMEGEMLAVGKHDELLKSSLEYCQIYNSQKSTNQYELHAE
ncbi:MAG: ABC transporter ATP-binding protein [Minisyncoccus archaeiphilus]|nr:MAG: putative ABC transporter ATP-binding protein [Parcubacteria group bacterium ADurb.Bin216]GMX59616.1 MAG: ABC transporter ATP-binding protein [Candidatus Parcubacteria bacterium]